MNYLDLINSQSKEIKSIYDILSDIMDNAEEEKDKSDIYYEKIMSNTNENVKTINERLNGMDLEIIDKDKLQSKKRDDLSLVLDKTIKENNKKNGTYKSELTKRLTKIKRETTEDFRLAKVEVNKNNQNKELIIQIKELEGKLETQSTEFDKYKKDMEKIHTSLRREMRLTRQLKADKNIKIKGLSIK